MNVTDATLLFRTESAAYPAVAGLAQSAYDQLVNSEDVDYRLLDELIGEASGKGVLRDMRRKYTPAEFDAIIGPVLTELGRVKPIRSSRLEWTHTPGADPFA
jgi:hypothetical protein